LTAARPFIPPALHELEGAVMEEVWRRAEATVRDVLEALNSSASRVRAYTTVMTVMSKLHSKGLLDRRREGKTDIYRPVMSREQYLEARARAEVGALVDEYGEIALVHFARQMADLDPERREQLRRLARSD
jgi:predicted transcriptional regulator